MNLDASFVNRGPILPQQSFPEGINRVQTGHNSAISPAMGHIHANSSDFEIEPLPDRSLGT